MGSPSATPAATTALSPAPTAAAQHLSQTILRDWKIHLRRLDRLLYADSALLAADNGPPRKTRMLWLLCRSQRELTLAHYQHASEGLALLRILRDLNTVLWMKTLQVVWPNVVDVVPTQEPQKWPRTVGIKFIVATAAHLDWIAERVVGVVPLSEGYKIAFAGTKRALHVDGGNANVLCASVARVPVGLTIDMEQLQIGGSRSSVLDRVIQIAVTQHSLMRLLYLEQAAQEHGLDGLHERTCFHLVGLSIE